MSESRSRDRRDRTSRKTSSSSSYNTNVNRNNNNNESQNNHEYDDDDDDDIGDDGLFLGFQHRMNTDERRRMREMEREEVSKRAAEIQRKASTTTRRTRTPGTRSTTNYRTSRPSPSSSHYPPQAPPQAQAAAPQDMASIKSSSSSASSARRTAYSRELEKRDQLQPTTITTSSLRRAERHRTNPPTRTSSEYATSTTTGSSSSSGLPAPKPLRSYKSDVVTSRSTYTDELLSSSRESRNRDRHHHSSSRRSSPKRERDRSPRRTKTTTTTTTTTSSSRRSRERRHGSGSPSRSKLGVSGGSHHYDDEERRRRREERRARESEIRRARAEQKQRRREEQQSRGGGTSDDDVSSRRYDPTEERSVRSHRSSRSSSRRSASHHHDDSHTISSTRSRYKYRSSSEDPGLRPLEELEHSNDALEEPRPPTRSAESRSRYARSTDLGRPRTDGSTRRHERRRAEHQRSRHNSGGANDKINNDSRSSDNSNTPTHGSRSPTPNPFKSGHNNNNKSRLVSDDEHVDDEALDDDVIVPTRNKMRVDSTGSSSSDSDDSENSSDNVRRRHRRRSNAGGVDDDEDEDDDDESSDDGTGENWTVRVCLIKGEDLPFNVVPNMPLCPILKFGLIRLAEDEVDKPPSEGTTTTVVGTRAASTPPKSTTQLRLEQSGLLSLPKARVRCTSSKVMSKRDMGVMEFHEDMRWDNVRMPNRTALAVELCARAAQPPPNYNEGPPVKESTDAAAANKSHQPPFELPPSFDRASTWATTTRPTEDKLVKQSSTPTAGSSDQNERSMTSPSPTPFGFMSRHASREPERATSAGNNNNNNGSKDEADAPVPATGIAGMRALLWRNGRQQLDKRQANKRRSGTKEGDTGNAAAAMARYLIGGGGGGGGGSNETSETTNDTAESATPTRQLGIQEPKRDVFGGSGSGGDRAMLTATNFAKRALPQVPAAQEEENVALVKPKKRRRIEMAQDMRLGALVIPLSRLPLAKATGRTEAARIEQWYQLDTTNNSLVPASSATQTRRGLRTARRNPSILLEISFSAPEVLDESEDELEESDNEDNQGLTNNSDRIDSSDHTASKSLENRSFSRRASNEMRLAQKATQSAVQALEKPVEEKKINEDPVLEPGVVDFVAVVGASNIGDQSDDNGSKGWVNSHPICAILEQFPPADNFHHSRGRNVTLQNKAEWFCFPEGCKLWRGAEPPSHTDLNLKRFSASSPPNVASSIAAFDACLNCTTSFSWFVIQSNEKENDFKNLKTYGAVIKFYAPAPTGIDPTQDDYAQTKLGGGADLAESRKRSSSQARRLWVPLGILMTSNLPIIGTMEAMLLRLCESLASRVGGGLHSSSHRRIQQVIHQDLANLIVNFQKPIPGVLHCSIPFLTGERLHLTVPPPTGLPSLPHGASVTSVCRLLGSEGLNVLLSAVLTECKILIHSHEISNLPMVAEVVTALIYPFTWSLPYLPVLPEAMLEFVEAPLSYFIGVPTCNVKLIDDSVMAEIVVIDLDNGFNTSDFHDGRRTGRTTKTPTPMPASVASNISKAVFRLLREEEAVEEEYGASTFPGSRSLPRIEAESLAEREFRIAVAQQICGLVRGYDDCLFKVSASQPVFNKDKFLRIAPALYEDRRGNMGAAGGPPGQSQPRIPSPRSKRFLSLLTNCQHFYQFLETLDHDECAFFNEVMYTFDMSEDRREADEFGSSNILGYGSSRLEEAASHLSKALQKVEDKIPTYRVDRKGGKKKRGGWDDDDEDEGGFEDLIDSHEADHDIGFSDDGNLISSFTSDLLQHVVGDPKANKKPKKRDGNVNGQSEPVQTLSVQYLAELEKGTHWNYRKLFEIPEDGKTDGKSVFEVRDKVKLRDAIGERRYRAWKVAQEQKHVAHETTNRMFTGDVTSAEGNTALDLTSLLSQVTEDTATDTSSLGALSTLSSNSPRVSSLSPEQQRVADAKDRDVLRRCLERAYDGGSSRRPARFGRRPSGMGSTSQNSSDSFFENGRDLIADAEAALRNPSAQKFLVSVLSQRSRLENQRRRRGGPDEKGRRGGGQASFSRLEPPAFECLVRLCCAMLDACLEAKNYESGYSLLTHTQGFCTVQSKDGKPLSRKDSDIDQATKVVHMTARIGLHPIFAELELWENVLALHLRERENDKNENASEGKGQKDADLAAYETTVSTLYEMLGYGIPSEELARFATRVSEKRGWFSTERGHSLLMLARRLSVKRDHGDDGTGNAGDLDMMRTGKQRSNGTSAMDMTTPKGASGGDDDGKQEWHVIGWCHPAATAQARPSHLSRDGDGPSSSARVGQNLLNMIDKDNPKKDEDVEKYMKRSAVTSLAAFGSSIVASGGLDGSVFVAHTIKQADEKCDQEHTVRGVRLDWGSSGSRATVVGSATASMDGEYGVGAVSVLAAAKGAGYRHSNMHGMPHSHNKDVAGKADDDDVVKSMEGCRVVAGTTGGDLRVWSVKDVYAATVLARKGDHGPTSEKRIVRGENGPSSAYVPRNKRGSITEIAAGTAFSRLKFSLRGRALSGHKGGVTCIDVPSHIYRPDALVTGGADSLIKLWSLRAPTGRRTSGDLLSGTNTPLFNTSSLVSNNASDPLARAKGRGGDALSILEGHNGRVLCVKTAWHGDRLLSGGADRTVRIWDLSASSGGGKCLHSLSGHLGWVTHTRYWGPNTIVSASTDRAIALWDARVKRSPLFVLRYHKSPISDLLVGSRTDPLMVSAGADGTVATWDFRTLSGANANEAQATPVHANGEDGEEQKVQSKAIRTPAATMTHCAEGKSTKQSGPVLLSRGPGLQTRTVLSVGVNAVAREWDIATGQMKRSEPTGHCDVVSCMHTFVDNSLGTSSGVEPNDGSSSNFGGTITSSWDGTIRMRKLVRR